MPTRGASLVLVLVLALAGCTGSAPPAQPSATATPGASPPVLVPSSPVPTAAPPSATPSPTPRVTPAPSPTPQATAVGSLPKPAGVRFWAGMACLLGKDPETASCLYPDEADDPDGTAPVVEWTRTVTWRAPRMEGVEIRVYGVLECVSMPASPKPDARGKCLVEHTELDKSALVLLATAPASARKASWTWRGQEPGCELWHPVGWTDEGFEQPYYAVVIAAYGPSGRPLSIFTIAVAADWQAQPDYPGDMAC